MSYATAQEAEAEARRRFGRQYVMGLQQYPSKETQWIVVDEAGRGRLSRNWFTWSYVEGRPPQNAEGAVARDVSPADLAAGVPRAAPAREL